MYIGIMVGLLIGIVVIAIHGMTKARYEYSWPHIISIGICSLTLSIMAWSYILLGY